MTQEPAISDAESRTATFGGRLVHLAVIDGDGPPVLLLGGCAVPSYVFARLEHQLAGRWTVALDRPGLLGTAWPGRLPTLAEEVATLVELCDDLGEPAVVVAHSMAGPYAEALTRLHPDAVRGLVLIDASVETDAKPPSPGYNRAWLAAARACLRGSRIAPVAAAGALLARVGVAVQSRRLHLAYAKPPRARGAFNRPDTLASVVAEQAAYRQQLADLQQILARTTWPGTPTVVLTAGKRKRWIRKQQVLATRTGGQQIVVPHSQHLMMVDQPEVVADTIRRLLEGSLPPPSRTP